MSRIGASGRRFNGAASVIEAEVLPVSIYTQWVWSFNGAASVIEAEDATDEDPKE